MLKNILDSDVVLALSWFSMDVEFADDDLARVETDPAFDAGLPPEVVKAFRARLDYVRGATDERFFYAMRSLHFEKLKGTRQDQYSMRINIQYRLILELLTVGTRKRVRIIEVTNHYE